MMGEAVQRPLRCRWVTWDGDNAAEVTLVLETRVCPGKVPGNLTLTCPVTRRSKDVEPGQVMVRWEDGSVTVFSPRAFEHQLRKTG